MTVISAVVGQVKPGRFDDVIEINAIAGKLLERHGAHDIRFLRGAVGAEGYGSAITSFEFGTAEAWGQFYDEVMVDDEVLAMIRRAEGADTPFTSTTVTMSNDITPRPPASTAKGRIIDVYISKPHPGRLADCITLAGDAGALFERHGGTNVRLLQQDLGGSQTESLILTSEWASMRAYGRAQDESQNDAGLQKIVDTVQGKNPPLTVLSHEAYAVVG